MKNSIMILSLAMLCSYAFCQHETSVDIQSPQFICQQENPGICDFLKQNISYPIIEEKYMIEGETIRKQTIFK